MMRGTLAELPKTQGTKIDDWRDEQPGRFVHELHTDPRAMLNYTPHSRYYGGVTGSIYYPVVLSAVWHWTGDKQLIKPYIEPALKGLAWADKYLRDGSGFYRYRTRSKQGERNQGWKDSRWWDSANGLCQRSWRGRRDIAEMPALAQHAMSEPPHAPASCSEIVSRPGNNLVQIRAADRTSGRGQLKPGFDGAA